jgi:hypothetical protein
MMEDTTRSLHRAFDRIEADTLLAAFNHLSKGLRGPYAEKGRPPYYVLDVSRLKEARALIEATIDVVESSIDEMKVPA